MSASQRITEPTLYPYIINYLTSLGLIGIQLIDVGRKYPDIEFLYNSEKFILEVKIGEPITLLKGFIQASEYAERIGTNNVIVVAYPPEVRRPLLPELIESIALDSRINALIITNYWKEDFIERPITLRTILTQLKEKIERKERVVSFDTVIKTLREGIISLSNVIRSLSEIKKKIIVNTIVGRFDLFLALGESAKSKKEELKLAAIDLASYLLVNQILFYHIYREKTKKVPPLPDKAKLDDLIECFKKIIDINYRAIYSVDIILSLPKIVDVDREIGNIVSAIKMLGPQYISHDLYGRLFHELLPPKTRKILAAFYTRPAAAEILATLTIDFPDEKVADFACGSGTLLVAAYRRKLRLLLQGRQSKLEEMIAHAKFVENDITGIDIMPFAAHLTAVNLAAQNPTVTTNKVRIGTKDALLCRPGYSIQPLRKGIQMTLTGEFMVREQERTVSPQGLGEAFQLEKVNSVIMNPPFTDKEKMPSDLKEKLKKDPSVITLREKCGGLINYWGYFVVLGDLFLRKRGKLGLVIPISIFKGRDTEKLRIYLIENYKIRYIVKTVKNLAFTEGASFRDVLFVAEKTKPKISDYTGVIFLKKGLDEMSIDEAREIAEKIRKIPTGISRSNKDFDIYWLSYDEIKKHSNHMMPLVAFQDIKTREIIKGFIDDCLARGGKKLRKIKEKEVIEGFHTSPKGLSQITFITRPLNKSRVSKAFLILKEERKEKLHLDIYKGMGKIIVDKKHFIPALRSGTGIRTIDITHKHDYIAVEEYENFNTIKLFSKWNKLVDWYKVRKEAISKKTYISITRRINPFSPNTHLLAFYSDKPFVPSDLLKKINMESVEEAKILSILFNSTFFLAQIFLYKEEATGTYPDIREDDLVNMYIFNLNKLSKEDKEIILKVFSDVRHVKFPSLKEQLKNRFWARVAMDKAILNILGFDEEDAEKRIFEVYNAILKEMKDFIELCKA